MFGSIEIVADCRRQEFMAEAARERLIRTATSGEVSAPPTIGLAAAALMAQAVATGTVALVTSLRRGPDRVSTGWSPAAGGR